LHLVGFSLWIVITVLMKVLLHINYVTVLGKNAFYKRLLKER